MSSYSLAVNTQESQFQQNHNNFLEKVYSGTTGSLSPQQAAGLKQTGFSVSHLLELGELPKENYAMFAAANSDSMNLQHGMHQTGGGHHSPVSGSAMSPTSCSQQPMHNNSANNSSNSYQSQRRFSGGHSDCSSPESGRKTGKRNFFVNI